MTTQCKAAHSADLTVAINLINKHVISMRLIYLQSKQSRFNDGAHQRKSKKKHLLRMLPTRQRQKRGTSASRYISLKRKQHKQVTNITCPMSIPMQMTLHIGNKSVVRTPNDSLRHATDVAKVVAHPLELQTVRCSITSLSLGRVGIWTGTRIGYLNELLIVGQLVLRIYSTTQVCAELKAVGKGTYKVDNHSLKFPPRRTA